MTSRVYHVMLTLLLVHTSNAGPIRETRNGRVEGVTKTNFTRADVDFFYGIPFAKPPVGSLRFEDPQEPMNWTGTRNATNLPTSCVQGDGNSNYVMATTKLAVMLFIHGGGNMLGSGLMFDGGYLASHGNIVVITINYRLHAFGFIGTGDQDFRGNYGILDQIMSMKWVKNNIAFFNGDPDKVTILGHSAGAKDVGLHLLSPLSKGLFRAVISQSGPPTSPIAWKYAGTDRMEEILQQFVEYTVILDGHFLPDDLIALMKNKDFSAKQYVIGVTVSECDFFGK